MEIEAKFILPDADTFERIRTLEKFADWIVTAGKTKRVHDVYLDTQARAILAAGYACRRRETSDGILITLKQIAPTADAIHRREEFEIALSSDQPPAAWQPSPARDLVIGIIGDAELIPLFDLRQTRTSRLIERDDVAIAEMSLDEVRVQAGKRTLNFRELEIELAETGTADDLAAMANYFQTEWHLQPEARSKFERALEFQTARVDVANFLTPLERAACAKIAAQKNKFGRRARLVLALDTGASIADVSVQVGLSARRVQYWFNEFQKKRLEIFPARIPIQETPASASRLPLKPGLTIDDSMSEAARKTLLFHFQRMLEHEAGTRLGEDAEELHDMRVATRRMRAALQVFDHYLDAEAMKPFAKSLRRTGRVLGVERDLDVFRDKALVYLAALPEERRNELEPLLVAWQREHTTRRAELLAHLDSKEYARFKETFGEFLDTPGAGALPILSAEQEPIPYRVRHILPGVLFNGYAQVRAYDEWFSEATVSLARYHQLRIASKRLRYTLEFFQEVLGKEAKPLIEQVKQLQDLLGNLQDAVVACNVLRDFLTWGTWSQTNRETLAPEIIVAPGVAIYLAARQAEIQNQVGAFPPVWAEIAGIQFNQRLATLVASF